MLKFSKLFQPKVTIKVFVRVGSSFVIVKKRLFVDMCGPFVVFTMASNFLFVLVVCACVHDGAN